MNYFAVDVGGSSVKYAVMTEDMHFLEKGKAESRHLQTTGEFVQTIQKLYRDHGSCEGGIAVSFCGEVNDQTGYLYSGGSYKFLAKQNLKELLEKACGTKVSIEHDGNSAGLAESRYGALHQGIHGFAGSASVMIKNIEEKFTKQSWAFRVTGAAWLGKEYAKRKGIDEEIDGIAFFEKVNAKDETAEAVLRQYCSSLANLLFNIHLTLDLEAIAVGGGISQQPILKEYLQEAFDDIFNAPGMAVLNLPKPELRICEFHNDANLIGALAHHLDQINRRV